jgi:NAD(P)-dependent dehydrogenase (short-subunit alcohol dehydrogenase family)
VDKKYVVITGASRGLGRGVIEKLGSISNMQVIGSARDPSKVKDLERPNITFLDCEMSSENSRNSFIERVLGKFPRVDVLVNNAGVFLDKNDGADTNALKGKLNTFRETLEINSTAPYHMMQAFLPSMIKNNYGRIVNVSSGMGQLSEMAGGYPAYRVSKTALNALTRVFAAEVKGKNILINSICPGWVKTDMGGKEAHRSIEEGIVGILWAMNLKDDGPSGTFTRDGKSIPW